MNFVEVSFSSFVHSAFNNIDFVRVKMNFFNNTVSGITLTTPFDDDDWKERERETSLLLIGGILLSHNFIIKPFDERSKRN